MSDLLLDQNLLNGEVTIKQETKPENNYQRKKRELEESRRQIVAKLQKLQEGQDEIIASDLLGSEDEDDKPFMGQDIDFKAYFNMIVPTEIIFEMDAKNLLKDVRLPETGTKNIIDTKEYWSVAEYGIRNPQNFDVNVTFAGRAFGDFLSDCDAFLVKKLSEKSNMSIKVLFKRLKPLLRNYKNGGKILRIILTEKTILKGECIRRYNDYAPRKMECQWSGHLEPWTNGVKYGWNIVADTLETRWPTKISLKA